MRQHQQEQQQQQEPQQRRKHKRFDQAGHTSPVHVRGVGGFFFTSTMTSSCGHRDGEHGGIYYGRNWLNGKQIRRP